MGVRQDLDHLGPFANFESREKPDADAGINRFFPRTGLIGGKCDLIGLDPFEQPQAKRSARDAGFRSNKRMIGKIALVFWSAMPVDVALVRIEVNGNGSVRLNHLVWVFRLCTRSYCKVGLGVFQSGQILCCADDNTTGGIGRSKIVDSTHQQIGENGQDRHFYFALNTGCLALYAARKVLKHVMSFLSNPQNVFACVRQGVAASVTDENTCAQLVFQRVDMAVNRGAVNVQRFRSRAHRSKASNA